MKSTFIAGLLCFFLLPMPVTAAETFIITEGGKPLAAIDKEMIILPFPELDIIDPVKYEQLERFISQKISKAPVNARIGKNGEIIPAKSGWKLNKHAFAEDFYSSFYTKGKNTIEISKIAVPPKVDSELLSQIHTKRIGQYVTYYHSGKKARANNIMLAVEAIDNYVLFPGEVFSFNQVVGKRTEARGYMKAPEIVKGKVIDGIGGGICQVSSTLFNAVDSSGMLILERYSHSKKVPYVPPGRDATVSWYGPDFVFKNNYQQPVLIRAHANHGRLVVILYSSDILEHNPRYIPNLSKDEALRRARGL